MGECNLFVFVLLADLLAPLDEFVRKTWPDNIVKVVRNPFRTGLIRARVEGARVATGDVLVFLDAHCEATDRWLEPLLYRIHEKPTAVVCPAIANIDKFTLTFLRSDIRYVAVFMEHFKFLQPSILPAYNRLVNRFFLFSF